MRIISFNIGIRIDNSSLVAEYLKSKQADIVCLQEAMRPLDERVYPLYRSEEMIKQALATDYPYYFFAPEWVADKLFESDGVSVKDFGGMVEQGKLVLSKYPITHGYDYFYHKNYELDRDRTNFYKGDDHGRSFQVCEIEIGGRIVLVGNVHGTYSSDKLDTEGSIRQSEFILERLKDKDLPMILVGDFNVLPGTKSISLIDAAYSNLNNSFNVSSTRPKGQMIDYAFIGKELRATSLIAEVSDISDHYPLILEIEML